MSHTVSTLSPTELASYRKALKSRVTTVRSRADSRLKNARKVASRAAMLLKKEFGVKKIVAFGSLTQPGLFHLRSDVDLAIWGLTGREYYRAVGILQSLDPDIQVDLIVFEDASKTIQETILREGKEL
jgi:predicted nucleotidyltransferase